MTAPTLLIVGGLDIQVLALNRAAQTQLRCPNELVVVPGATHLFEKPGALSLAAHMREAGSPLTYATPRPPAADPPERQAEAGRPMILLAGIAPPSAPHAGPAGRQER